MIDLDDINAYSEYDLENMIGHLTNIPELYRTAWRKAMIIELPEDYANINRMMILGTECSAIGGDLISSLIINEAQIPMTVNRGYDLPAYVDEQTLVIACSYSGYTEETISAFAQALDINARCMVISTGGKLKEIAEEKHLPLFTFDYNAQPRSTLPFSFMAIYCTLQKLGIIGDKSAEIAETIKILEQLSQQLDITVPLEKNQAKQMAQKLYGKFIFIYGSEITSEIACRWKTQLNENSKNWAASESFSELNHNSIAGYRFPAEFSKNALIILLRSSLISKAMLARYQATCRILEHDRIKYSIVDTGGESALAQMLSLVLLGDYISYYLAILNEVDPAPVRLSIS